jgi:glycosyltransferase involved in cell wall biosynthesis
MQNEENILVSVVTCFYNEERFLAETVQSVIDQTYTHWELILVDDGSSDGSTRIAKEFAQQYPGKCFYHEHPNHENRGVCASKNRGFSQTRGEWIALLDADDVWLPDKLENQLKIIKENPRTRLLCEASVYWHEWKSGTRKNVVVFVGGNLSGLYEPPSLVKLLYPLGKGAAPCPSGVMVKKETIESVGGFEEHFREKYQVYEDQAFLIKIYLENAVYISRAAQNLYRQREGSLVFDVWKKGNYEAVRKYFLEWLDEYIRKNQLGDRKIKRMLGKAFFRYRSPGLFAAYLTLVRIAYKMKYKKIKTMLKKK